MEYRTFGRTGLRVSIVGLGGGGASRLGLTTGGTEDQAVAVVKHALELGINYFDTATEYPTEGVIGRALQGHRDEAVISSKILPRSEDGILLDAPGLRRAVEASLRRLQIDAIDVYHLHRAVVGDYAHYVEELVPEFETLKREGKVRFVGISENTSGDPSHQVLRRAVQDGCWDVMMVGFNLFNQSARSELFPRTIEQNIAIEIMASARTQFSRPELLAQELLRLVESGQVDRDQVNLDDPVDFLHSPGASSLTDVSYRFAAHEPGVHVVLVGTGNLEHLDENVHSLTAGPLPAELHDQLLTNFGHLSEAVFVPGRVVGGNVGGGSITR